MTWESADYSSEILCKIWKCFILDKTKRRQEKNGVTSPVLKRAPEALSLVKWGGEGEGKEKEEINNQHKMSS